MDHATLLPTNAPHSNTCRFCGFDRFTTVLMPEDHPHYAALRCGQCDGLETVERISNKVGGSL